MNLPQTITLPLTTDERGVIRVSNTRVTLHTLLAFYKQGEGPEALHEGFPTVPLADIHAVIAYYLANQAEIDDYLAQLDAKAERMREEMEKRFPPITKAELQARLDAQQKNDND
jgi:uncharacterized protein (DUF433 family)